LVDPPSERRPLTFWQAAAFHWVNPKAWIIVVGALSTYAPSDDFAQNVLVLAVLLGLVNAPSLCVWAGFGTVLAAHLAKLSTLDIAQR
jgi:threonine/homoserine/homoserine lactone efflux protein